MISLLSKKSIIEFILRIIAAVILIQTLFFKFTGAAESVYIFTKLNAEPAGRYALGIIEAIASLFLFIPRLKYIGALIAVCLMAGAILSHIFILGITIMNDRGELFIFGLIVFACCSYLLIKGYQRRDISLIPLHI